MPSDLIYREDAKDYARHAFAKGLNVLEYLEEVPAANFRPVVRGRWEVDGHHIRCSICGEYMCIKDREGAEIPRKYCPNCGADMREEGE